MKAAIQAPEFRVGRTGREPASHAAELDNSVFQVDPSVIARRRENRIVLVSRILLGVLFLAGWELASGTIVKEFWVSSPLGVLAALVKLANSGGLGAYVMATVNEAAAGFVFGALGGIL